MNVTLTTLNIQGFESWDERLPHLRDYYKETRPDIACFQEVVYLPNTSPFTPVQILNQELGYDYEASDISRLQRGVVEPVYREGLSTLAKFPLLKSESIVLKREEGDEHNRIVQLLDVRAGDHILKIAHVHFSITDFTDYATPQLEETLALLKSRGETRVIIGDFNLTHLEESQGLWSDEYQSTCETPYITYPVWKDGPKRVDYALVPKEYAIESISVSPDGLSDHRALTVTISLPD